MQKAYDPLADSARAAKQSAEAAAENAQTAHEVYVASQRAWLSPQNAFINPDTPISKGAPLRIEVIYSNSGREPALDFNSRLEGATELPPPHWQTGEWVDFRVRKNNTCEGLNPIENGPVIYPILSAFAPPRSIFTGINDSIRLAQIATAQVVLAMQGCLVYNTYGKRRESAFCFFLAPILNINPDKWTFRDCFSGNHAN
jgi:hypothetical protein